MRGDTLCHAAFDAVTKSSRTPMRDPGIPAFVISHSNAAPSHPAPRCGIQRIPSVHRGKPSGPVGTHGPCIQNLPFLFPQKKRESQKKAPGRCPKAEKWLRGPGGKNSPGSLCIRSEGYTAPGSSTDAPGSSTDSPRLKHLFPSFGPLRHFSLRFLP